MLPCISSLCPLGALSQGFGRLHPWAHASPDTRACTHILLTSASGRTLAKSFVWTWAKWLKSQELQVLSLTGSIVKDIKQKQPWAGFAVLAVGDGFHSSVWRLALRAVLLCELTSQWGRGKRTSSAAQGSQEWRWAPSIGELLTTRMGMCHLAASEHQLTRSWGALCPCQAAQSLGTLLRIRQGAHTSSPPSVV